VTEPNGTRQDRSAHVPDHALMAVVFPWSVASVCPPEKRKVGGSTPPLTTRSVRHWPAQRCAKSGRCRWRPRAL